MTVGGGIEPLLRGLAFQQAREIDCYVEGDIRNFLFGAPGSGGFDLAALNIQRGRDHGLPRYNAARAAMGLTTQASFADVSSDAEIQTRLANAYASVDDIDLWVGGLAEDALPGAMVGELFHAILVDQFERLRDGDRFWYESYLPQDLVNQLEWQTLARVIRRNTDIEFEIYEDVFHTVGTLVDASPGPRLGQIALSAPYPNPATGPVAIELTVPSANQSEIDLGVYDIRGRQIASLHAGPLRAGLHRFRWDRRDQTGHRAPAGIYFLQARTPNNSPTSEKIVVVD